MSNLRVLACFNCQRAIVVTPDSDPCDTLLHAKGCPEPKPVWCDPEPTDLQAE